MRMSTSRKPTPFDKEVYAVVRKYIDNIPAQSDLRTASVGSLVPRIYQYIKSSNSSLARRKKLALENSIERIIETLIEEEGEEENKDIEGEEEGSDSMEDLNFEQPASEEPGSSRAMNLAVVRNYSAVLERDGTKSRKRDRSGNFRARRKESGPSDGLQHSFAANLEDMAGVDEIIDQLEDLLSLPLTMPEIYTSTEVPPPRGIILHGPPGCGKTTIANAFARELAVPYFPISAPSIVAGTAGESEKAVRELFQRAISCAPCLMFIDEIDVIANKREGAQRDMEKRIVAQLATCLDDLSMDRTRGQPVIVLAATNRLDSLDGALRRGGRFDIEIAMPMPDETARTKILKALTRRMPLSKDVDFVFLARKTPSFVGADLKDLVSTSGRTAIRRTKETLQSQAAITLATGTAVASDSKALRVRSLLAHIKNVRHTDRLQPQICNQDFLDTLPHIQSSARREGFTRVPSTTWGDVGALSDIRIALDANIIQPILRPEDWERVGIVPSSGVLLWGPPGCGKTLLAKAVANQSQAAFISIKGPELLSKFVGDSERRVREVFTKAKSSVPCIIFLDEVDALVPRRDDSTNEASSRVVSTLLTELDGLDSREGVYVIGATNRPNQIDEAITRPGRFETLLFVGLPSADERVDILQTLARPLTRKVEGLADVARACDGFSGADLGSLLREAGTMAIRRRDYICIDDLWQAREKVKPSVRNYERYKKMVEHLGK